MASSVDVVRAPCTADTHQSGPDQVRYDEMDMRGVVEHRQVTDAYFAGPALASAAYGPALAEGRPARLSR